MLGEVPQASGGLHDDSAHSINDGGDRKNNGGTAFGACLGFKANQTGTVQ